MLSSRVFKTFLVVIIVLALSGFTYAFAAANIVPASSAGDGAGAISGYTVTNIQYNLNAANPANIDSVSFALSAAAGTVMASVTNAAPYSTCALTTGTWKCTLPANTTVLSATNLRVIATSN
jgi:hypothetical protein